MARGVQVDAPTRSWGAGFEQVEATTFTLHSILRPCIGASPTTSPKLVDFLRQQGYIVEVSKESQHYPYYCDQTEFTEDQELSLLTDIEETAYPLARLSRWPNGAYSALCVTGDIDALTLFNYGQRLLGR